MKSIKDAVDKYGYLIYILFLLSIVVFGVSIYNRYYNFHPRVIALDVGQGSSNILDLSPQNLIIIDGGPDNSLIRKLGKYLPFWKRDILALVVTNGDKDHYFGFMDLCRSYKVGMLIVPPKSDNKEGFSELISCFKGKGTAVIRGYLGKNIKIGDNNLSILFPDRSMSGFEENDSSLILRLSGKDRDKDFTFMGDSPKKIERYLLKILYRVRTDYIVLGHHGSKTSSDKKWIKEFGRGTAIISAGKDNRYGHPNKETLETLNTYSMKVLSTINDGDIELNI